MEEGICIPQTTHGTRELITLDDGENQHEAGNVVSSAEFESGGLRIIESRESSEVQSLKMKLRARDNEIACLRYKYDKMLQERNSEIRSLSSTLRLVSANADLGKKLAEKESDIEKKENVNQYLKTEVAIASALDAESRQDINQDGILANIPEKWGTVTSEVERIVSVYGLSFSGTSDDTVVPLDFGGHYASVLDTARKCGITMTSTSYQQGAEYAKALILIAVADWVFKSGYPDFNTDNNIFLAALRRRIVSRTGQ